jgi:hypothetical protein
MAKLTDLLRPFLTRRIDTTAPLAGGGDLNTNRTLSIPAATDAVDGHLTAADHASFAAKQAALGFAPLNPANNLSDVASVSTSRTNLSVYSKAETDTAVAGATGGVPATRQFATTAPLAGGGDFSADRTLSLPASDATHDGYLSAVNWVVFNGYGASITANTSNISALSSTLGSLGGTVSALSGLLATAVQGTRNLNTTAPLAGGGDLSSDRTLSMPAATDSVDGYLTAVDHAAFSTASAGGTPSTRLISTTAPLAGGGNLSANRTLSIAAANGSTDGYLTSGNWTTFNNKVGTARLINTTAPLIGGGDLSADRTLSMPAATDLVAGYLTAADHAAFATAVAGGVSNARAINTTAPLTGGGNLSADRTLAIAAATDSVDGYMTAIDHVILTGKLAKAGGTMTGDLVVNSRFTPDKVSGAISVLTYAATTNIDFDALTEQTLAITGNTTFTTSNRLAGRKKLLKILCDSGTRGLTFPAWKFVGTPTVPAVMFANTTAFLLLECFDANDTGVVARWIAEASGGDLLKSNNLSDIPNITTAATNLGVYKITNNLLEVTNPASAQTNLQVLSKNDSESGDSKRSPHGALMFDGSSGAKITGTSPVNLGLFDFTIAIIYEPMFLPGTVQTLFESHSAGSNRIRVQIGSNGQSILLLITNNSAVETTYTLTPALTYVVGTAYTFVIACARSGSAFLYVNSLGTASTAISAQVAVDIGSGNANPYTVGGALFGQIHKVLVFRRQLTATEASYLTRKGLADASDQWAAFSALYTSNFSVGADGFTSTAGLTSLTGNVDSVLAHNDTLQLITDTSNGLHYATKTGVFTVGKRYRIDLVYYIPASQTTNAVQIASGTPGVSGVAGTLNFSTTGSWQTTFGELTATGTSLQICGASGSATSYTGVAAQSVYIGSLVVTQIGAGLDLDCELADPASSLVVQDLALANHGAMSSTGISQIRRDRNTLRRDANLSDLGSLATSRTNLGVFSTDELRGFLADRTSRPGLVWTPSLLAAGGIIGVTLGLADFSFSCTIKAADYTPGTQIVFLQSHWNGANRVRFTLETTGIFTVGFFDGSSALTSYSLTPDFALVDGETYVITIACSRAGNAVLYINGLSDRDANGSGVSVSIAASSSVDIGNGNTNLWSGLINFVGQIKSLRLFNRALSATDALLLAKAGLTSFDDQWGSAAALNSGGFTIGKRYRIVTRASGDFTTVGSANNTVGTEFIATAAGTVLDASNTALPIGAVFDLDLGISKGLYLPNRAASSNYGTVPSSVAHVEERTSGDYCVEITLDLSAISSTAGTTALFDLPRNCAVLRVQFEILTAADASTTLDVGISGTSAKYVSAASVATLGLVYADALSKGIESSSAYTSVYLKKNQATTTGRVRIVVTVDIRGK